MLKSAFGPADILVPSDVDMRDWSVIACDQFTSEKEYWDRVAENTRGKLSTFNMIMPEAYLNDVSAIDTAAKTCEAMESYLAAGVFETLRDSFVYVERAVTGGIRHGLVGVIDLEAYDYTPMSSSPVRASERTVAERLPARMLIREKAVLEAPHILVLIDDPEKSVVEPLRKKTSSMRKLYDFELMEDGGHIKGWQVDGENAASVQEAIAALSSKELQFVIGDGNHSLAAAKELWEKIKLSLSEEKKENHPARFALVELNNVYDDGIRFEPIHRVMFNTVPERVMELMHEKLETPDGRAVQCVIDGKKQDVIHVKGKSFGNMIDILQDFLEEYAAFYDGSIDYIHDEEAVIRLTHEEGSIGFLLPGMAKEDLFKTVMHDGVFPKKSFSIGHAKDKRYYLECRKIK